MLYCGLTFISKATKVPYSEEYVVLYSLCSPEIDHPRVLSVSKELQNYVYLRVKQVAFIQVSPTLPHDMHRPSFDIVESSIPTWFTYKFTSTLALYRLRPIPSAIYIVSLLIGDFFS